MSIKESKRKIPSGSKKERKEEGADAIEEHQPLHFLKSAKMVLVITGIEG